MTDKQFEVTSLDDVTSLDIERWWSGLSPAERQRLMPPWGVPAKEQALHLVIAMRAGLAHDIGHAVIHQMPHHARETPSSFAEFVGALFVKPELRDHVLGCRAEHFARNVKRFGRKRATLLYWWDALVSLREPLWSLVKRLAGATAVADLYRRYFSGG